MAKEKKSFFERLTGTVKISDREFSNDSEIEKELDPVENPQEEEREGQLTVDVYEDADQIVIKTMVAGVRPEDLDISITRDLVTIKGKREEDTRASGNDFFIRELYWGAFSRTITLPSEVDVEESEAVEKHGLLIIKLPKIDKGRQTKLRVKTV